MLKLMFMPVRLIGGMVAGVLATKVFERLWGVGPQTPRLSQVLGAVTQTLIENPGQTFAEIPLLLWNEEFRRQLVRRFEHGSFDRVHARANLREVASMLLEDGEPRLEAEFIGTEAIAV